MKGKGNFKSVFKQKEATVLCLGEANQLHWEHKIRQTGGMVDKGGRSELRKKSLNQRTWCWQYMPEGLGVDRLGSLAVSYGSEQAAGCELG